MTHAMTTTQAAAPPATERVFTVRKDYWCLAIAGVTICPVLAALGVWLPLANPDGSFPEDKRIILAMFIGGVFGTFALLSAYLLLACGRTRVEISPTAARAVGAFRDRTVVLADVTNAVWRAWPRGGSLVLYSPVGRVVLEVGVYRDGRELVRFFRQALPLDRQHGYERFPSRS
jgi:hypothetical protein